MRLKCAPLPITQGMEDRLHQAARSCRAPSRSAAPAAAVGVGAKPFGQTLASGAPELLSTRLCPPLSSFHRLQWLA